MGKCKGLREVKEIKTRDRYHGITQWYIWEIKKSIHPKLQNTNDLRVLNSQLHFIPLGHKICKLMKTTSPLPLLKKNKVHL